jgi:hypothetical protein
MAPSTRRDRHAAAARKSHDLGDVARRLAEGDRAWRHVQARVPQRAGRKPPAVTGLDQRATQRRRSSAVVAAGVAAGAAAFNSAGVPAAATAAPPLRRNWRRV